MKDTPEVLQHFPVVAPLAVRWSDMDAAAIVNNVHYFRWMEMGRIKLLEEIGITDYTGKTTSLGIVVGKAQCTYITPVSYPDTILVASRVLSVEVDRCEVENALYSTAQQRMIAVGKVRLVCFDIRKMAKADLPADWRAGLEGLHRER